MAAKAKNILIVEDEKQLSYALRLKLQFEGFTVAVASNGHEALQLASEQRFDVVLLDLIMPEMDGFQVLEGLKKTANPPIVIVLSNLSQHEDEERALSLGAHKFFIKSDTPLTTIIETVRSL